MAARKTKKASAKPKAQPTGWAPDNLGTILGTFSGSSTAAIGNSDIAALADDGQQSLARQKMGAQVAAHAVPANPLKAGEYGMRGGHTPQAGEPHAPLARVDRASTVQESNASGKLGKGEPANGHNPGNESLDRVRVDSSNRALTTNMGTTIADNQNSLRAGLRGPTLLEDFILREKITHFDHERIPERIVHARGSAAHGYFESYEALTELTRAAPFSAARKRTPVFVRFSTVAGERGSADLARDVRGFAVKFYTDEGNWDIVGNNMPVFFIQDAMKFPDLVHAVKPEPHNAMPQAASAHDTFWDFVSLMPESTHMLLWVMSDRAIPRSYRMMQGFGVHTFRLVNDAGESQFVKFHWTPVAGTHSVAWDEAVKINGADPDFHRRDLWEAIEAGAFPEWELGMQIFSEEMADGFSFDVLDATTTSEAREGLLRLRESGLKVAGAPVDALLGQTDLGLTGAQVDEMTATLRLARGQATLDSALAVDGVRSWLLKHSEQFDMVVWLAHEPGGKGQDGLFHFIAFDDLSHQAVPARRSAGAERPCSRTNARSSAL